MFFAMVLLFVGLHSLAFSGEPSHGLSYFGDLKYPKGFPHFDYANANAPKGGRLRQPVMGTFNSLNPFIDKGIKPECNRQSGCMLIYDRLMSLPALDEQWSLYGYLADSVELADDYTWVAYTLRDGIRWHDGVPVTVEDVIWTFNTLKAKGRLVTRSTYKDTIRVEQTGPRSFRFHFSKNALKNRQLAMTMSFFIPLPKHHWENREFAATSLEPPLGSGPYRIKEADPGHKIVYERVKDYWGKDLNVNTGRHNFDTIEFIYFLDKTVAIQALKGGIVDYSWEDDAKRLATAYDFDAFHRGLFRKETRELKIARGMYWGIYFNTRKEKLRDVRVREALALAYNFEWSNRTLTYGAEKRCNSYFTGLDLAAAGLPSAAELALLAPFRDHIPARVFTHVFALPENHPFGRNRDALLQADALLVEAGWIVKDYRRVSRLTGDPFTLDVIASSVEAERTLSPYVETLQRLGIASKLRRIEKTQMVYRLRKYDFEVMFGTNRQYSIPMVWSLRPRFLSRNADRHDLHNYPGIKEPAVDFLVEGILAADSKEGHTAAGRALDRILLWQFYMIPGG